jgi:putative peptidoglycan lipid II flippase
MVKNILNKVYTEVRGLHQAAYILALFTFGSQILALVRDRLLAHQFGAGVELDIYYTAFRIPDLLYVLFASTLSVYVLIPFVTKRAEKSVAHARIFLSQIFSLFLFVYVAIAVVVMIVAPYIVPYFFPGFSAHADTLVLLIRILLIQPLILGVSSLYGVITQMERRFLLYALSPLIYNLGIIGGLVFLYPYMGISGLAVGVVLGALGHLCIQIPFVLKNPLAPFCTYTYDWKELFEVCRTSVTRVMTLSLHQLVLLGLIGFASGMAVGSVSVFQFALNLQSVPLAIIGVSYSVAMFPHLAQLYAEKNIPLFRKNVTTALRHIVFWSFPATALFVVIRAQFVRVVLGSGAFGWNDTRLTAAVLALFILSLASQAINLLIVRTLYAVGNTRLPFFVTFASSLLALILAFIFYQILSAHGSLYTLLQHTMRLDDVHGIEVLALPMGYSLALIANSVVMLFCARRHIFISLTPLLKPCMQSFLAALVGGYVAYTVLNHFVILVTTDTLFSVLAQGSVAAILGCFGYICMQYLFKNEELEEIRRALTHTRTKQTIVPPQDEDTFAI